MALAAAASMLVAVPAGRAATVSARYQFASTSTATSTFSEGGVTLLAYSITGGGSCQPSHPCGPSSGTFSLGFTSRFQPQDPYRIKRGAGSLAVSWSDATASTGSFTTVRFRDDHKVVATGTVTAGTFAGKAVSALLTIALPSDPCHSAFNGPITFG